MFNQHQSISGEASAPTKPFTRIKQLTFQTFHLLHAPGWMFCWALWRVFQVFGGLVWILVASTHVNPPNPLGWVMFVSVFCFVMTFLWMIIFMAGCHKNSPGWAAAVRPWFRGERDPKPVMRIRLIMWPCSLCVQDFAYHGLAAFFYLSAAVILASITIGTKSNVDFKIYQINIAAVVRSEDLTLKNPKGHVQQQLPLV